MELREKIGEGHYRTCFATDDTSLCAKKMKPTLEKTLLGFIEVNVSAKLYTLLLLGTKDLNRKELDITQSLPFTLQSYLPSTIFLQEDCLVMERPIDFDGAYSSTLQEYGPVGNEYFRNCVQDIRHICIQNNLRFLDTFHRGNNILVKRISEHAYKPILIDLKRLDPSFYPLQPHLR